MKRHSTPTFLFFIACVANTFADNWPADTWQKASPASVDLNAANLKKARDYALTGGGSGVIVRHGKLVTSWGDLKRKYDLKSTTKSIGVTALGLAIGDGKMKLSDFAVTYHPAFATPPASNQKTGWVEKITLLHLTTQTAGFEKPGGYTKLIFEPGSKWSYSDGGPNWLAECITLAYKRDVDSLLFERVFTPIGIKRTDLSWRKNSYRNKEINGYARREFGSGISANVQAMARIGYLYLRKGKWKDEQIIPQSFVAAASKPVQGVVGLPEVDGRRFGDASEHYGLLWWNNADGELKNVPRDAYWSWGLHESLIVVIPSLDMVVARAGKGWQGDWAGHYDRLEPFLNPIVAAAKETESKQRGQSEAPYPQSPVIAGVEWAPPNTIIRKAKGGDNWPMTWADDNAQYTAFGDGHGFNPKVEKKLSLGICKVTGDADDFTGVNIRSKSAERTGGGKSGPKVSGMLMVEGVLHMLVRNTSNSQLAWSADHGKHWEWSDWKFTTSFGYPTFLNFGKNYAGARDDYVYIYSHDSNSAYERADRMVLARVLKSRIREQKAYEYFERIADGKPVWSNDIQKRGAVFSHSKQCYRSSVSYNAGLGRYLWCQTGQGKESRFAGGLGIYDAPTPWGPWTTVYFTSKWDVGPGETSCLPTKWMSKDGQSVTLVFSGDDAFSVRAATLQLTPER